MSSGAAGGKSSKKDRTRKSAQNLRYKNENRHAKSHVRRITKHIKRYGGTSDKVALKALDSYKRQAGIR
jgi:hypothetical protein